MGNLRIAAYLKAPACIVYFVLNALPSLFRCAFTDFYRERAFAVFGLLFPYTIRWIKFSIYYLSLFKFSIG